MVYLCNGQKRPIARRQAKSIRLARLGIGLCARIGYARQMTFDATTILAIMAGGALGAVARGWVCARVAGPVGVLVVNASGGLLIGVLAAQAAPDSALWLFAMTGVIGAYTTVSAFALQSVQMWQAGKPWMALANGAGSVVVAVSATALGMWSGGL